MDLSTFRYTHNLFCLLIIIKFIVVLSHSQAKPRQAQFYDKIFMYFSSERELLQLNKTNAACYLYLDLISSWKEENNQFSHLSIFRLIENPTVSILSKK